MFSFFPAFFELAFLFMCSFFCLRFFSFSFQKGCLHSGRSEITRVTVGRYIHQSLGACGVNLATLKVAIRTTNTTSRTNQHHEQNHPNHDRITEDPKTQR